MIRLQNITKSFGKHEVLKGIDLTVNKGEVVVILGPSGSGKTTLLRCINYLEKPNDGEVSIGDFTVNCKRPAKRGCFGSTSKDGYGFPAIQFVQA